MAGKSKPIRGSVLFKILTSGIYTTLTQAIKEAVSNSYDAGAENVSINFDPQDQMRDAKPQDLVMIIRDDGGGMSLKEFWNKFATVESDKNPLKKDTTTGRYPIGRFGIGSLALVPFARKIAIYSKSNRQKPIKCEIDAQSLMDDRKSERQFHEHVTHHVSATSISKENWETAFGSNDSGTIIRIKGVTNQTHSELIHGKEKFDLKGLRKIFPGENLTDGLREIAWDLSTLLPLKYKNDSSGLYRDYKEHLEAANTPIAISLSSVELSREIYSSAKLLSKKAFDYQEDGVEARGLLVVSDGTVEPPEANGILLRLANVGIGSYRLFGLTGQATIQRKITGEIHIVKGLHTELNAARNDFSGPEYDRLRASIHKELQALRNKAYKRWQSRKQAKATTAEDESERRHIRLLKQKKKSAKKRASAKPTKAGPRREKGSSGSAPSFGFDDPVASLRSTTGKMRVKDDHELFRFYSGVKEKETVRALLRALKLAGVSGKAYALIIQNLIDLKKD